MINGNDQKDLNDANQDEILSSLLGRLGLSSTGDPPTGNQTAPVSAGDTGGDLLSSLLSSPELLSKLPSIISSIKPIIELLGKRDTLGTSQPAISTSKVSEPTHADHLDKSGRGSDSRTALLCAMKPYLSQDRRNAIDYIVKLGRLGDILKTL